MTIPILYRGACHQAITDFQFLVSKTFGRIMEVRSDLSPKIAMDVNRKATLAFFSKHLGKFVQSDDMDGGFFILPTTVDFLHPSKDYFSKLYDKKSAV